MNQQQIDQIFNDILIRMLMINPKVDAVQEEMKIMFTEGIIRGQQYVIDIYNKTRK